MKKKLLALLCAVTMAGTMTSGSVFAETNEEATEFDTSEEVELVMYVVGDRPAGQDVVDENLNELLKEKLNCTLQINWIGWAEYATKYPLLFSSGEKFDIAYTAVWLNWKQLARKGAFMNLDELWPTYAPDNWAATTDSAKSQAMVDGSYYCIPTQKAVYTAYGVLYRTKFDDGKEYTEEVTDWDSYSAYLAWVKENEPDFDPLEMYSAGSDADDTWMASQGYWTSKAATNDFLFFDYKSDDPQLLTYYEYENIDEFLTMTKEWEENGYFSKSALADTDSEKMLNGIAASKFAQYDNLAVYSISHPDWGLKYVNLRDCVSHSPYTQDAMAISNTSENPERALMFWNLVTTDQEVYDAFYYGVLGETYTLNDEGQYSITDSNLYATSNMWAVRTNELDRDLEGTPAEVAEAKAEWEASIAEDQSLERFASFTVDTSNIETEYAACQNVHQQYWWPLELGYTDKETGLQEYKEKMEAAGIEKVKEEIQKQLDEYVANMNQ